MSTPVRPADPYRLGQWLGERARHDFADEAERVAAEMARIYRDPQEGGE